MHVLVMVVHGLADAEADALAEDLRGHVQAFLADQDYRDWVGSGA